MDPVEALKRIAFLLERSQAPTYASLHSVAPPNVVSRKTA
jgi:hypothetical protein